MSVNLQAKLYTPEVLWHGGGNEMGKPDPVYSVDLHPTQGVLATTGIDGNVPPKGSVRLWKVDSASEGQEFLLDLADHGSAVNIARFSPCGKMLASASDRQIVIYVASDVSVWPTVTDIRSLERIWLKPSLTEIFDLQWSPDSTYVVVGAIDSKAEIIRISSRDNLILSGHSNYVQGVAWDPFSNMIVTESSDRSCKVHMLKYKEGMMVKLGPRGHAQFRMHTGYTAPAVADPSKVLSASDFGLTENGEGHVTANSKEVGINLYADSYVPSFFRRLTFTPDGQLLITPTGIHRPPASLNSNTPKSFCTHIFSRQQLMQNATANNNNSSASNGSISPCMSLIGLEDPSIAVRCCPRLFKLLPSGSPSLIPGDYRIVFAVITIKSVFIYDTQHSHPIAKYTGQHFAPINDAAWSGDGLLLTVCSSDGYLSFIRFREGSLGTMLDLDSPEVPEVVKKTHPCLYRYTPTVATPVSPATPSTAAGAGKGKKEKKTSGGTGGESDSVSVALSTEEGVSAAASTAGSVEASPVIKATAAASGATEDAKKRKRIQPVMIAALGSSEDIPTDAAAAAAAAPSEASTSTAGAAGGVLSSPQKVSAAPSAAAAATASVVSPSTSDKVVVDLCEASNEPASAAAAVSAAAPSDVTGSASKKKRIAPVLLTNVTAAASPAVTEQQ